MEELKVIRIGTLDMQVCVPEYLTDAQVKEFADERNHCGTENGWQIRKEGDRQLGGMPERNPCSERKGCVHITLGA